MKIYMCIIVLIIFISRILVDTGDAATSGEYIKNLKDTLENYHVVLQNIIITHWHPDHAGGISEVLKNCPCGKYLHITCQFGFFFCKTLFSS